MAQSVKRKDGSYIDTEGIYDVTQGKTQKDINALDGMHTVSLSSYSSAYTNGTLSWQKCGHVVTLILSGAVCSAEGAISISRALLGFPKPLIELSASAASNGYHSGQFGWLSASDSFFLSYRPDSNKGATNASGVLTYCTEE